MGRRKAILLFTLLGNLVSLTSWAQVARGEIGAVYSAKQAGITYVKTGGEREPWSVLRLTADIWDVVKGESDLPGVKMMYDICYPVKSWTSLNTGTRLDIVAGPGISAGLVRDHEAEKYHAIFGLSGMIGIFHHFAGNVAIGIDLSGEVAISARGRKFESTKLSFYKHGIMQFPIPELLITYRF